MNEFVFVLYQLLERFEELYLFRTANIWQPFIRQILITIISTVVTTTGTIITVAVAIVCKTVATAFKIGAAVVKQRIIIVL